MRKNSEDGIDSPRRICFYGYSNGLFPIRRYFYWFTPFWVQGKGENRFLHASPPGMRSRYPAGYLPSIRILLEEHAIGDTEAVGTSRCTRSRQRAPPILRSPQEGIIFFVDWKNVGNDRPRGILPGFFIWSGQQSDFRRLILGPGSWFFRWRLQSGWNIGRLQNARRAGSLFPSDPLWFFQLQNSLMESQGFVILPTLATH